MVTQRPSKALGDAKSVFGESMEHGCIRDEATKQESISIVMVPVNAKALDSRVGAVNDGTTCIATEI